MKPAFEKLRERREELGQSPDKLAAAIGISTAWYHDLEGPDELETNLDLDKLVRLSSELNIPPASLFCDEVALGTMSPVALADLIRTAANSGVMSLEQLEEVTGWELHGFLHEPNSDIRRWSVDKLKAVCSAMKRDWIPVLNGISESDLQS